MAIKLVNYSGRRLCLPPYGGDLEKEVMKASSSKDFIRVIKGLLREIQHTTNIYMKKSWLQAEEVAWTSSHSQGGECEESEVHQHRATGRTLHTAQ